MYLFIYLKYLKLYSFYFIIL